MYFCINNLVVRDRMNVHERVSAGVWRRTVLKRQAKMGVGRLWAALAKRERGRFIHFLTGLSGVE